MNMSSEAKSVGAAATVADDVGGGARGEDISNEETSSRAIATTNTVAAATKDKDSNSINNPRDSQFDHTSRKVVVRNVLKFIRNKEIDKIILQWLSNTSPSQIEIVKYKKPPKDNWMKVTLKDESMVNPFIELINKGGENGKPMVNGRGGNLFAKRADEMFNDRDGKRKNDDTSNNGGETKRQRAQSNPPQLKILSTDEVRSAITPLWNLSYEEQLQSKSREMVHKCAMKIIKEIKGKFRTIEREAKRDKHRKVIPLYEWVAQKRAIEMNEIVKSPCIYEYRNKCEFTVGYKLVPAEDNNNNNNGNDEEDQKKEDNDEKIEGKTDEPDEEDWVIVNGNTVKEAVDGSDDTIRRTTTNQTPPSFQRVPAAGFLAQGWNGGVYPPHSLQNMPDWSCGVADMFNDFLPKSSMPPYDSKTHRGFWRTITLRCSLRTKECMVIVLHAPAKGGAGAREDGSDDYTSVFGDEKQRLVEMLTRDVIPSPTARNCFPEDYYEKKKESNEDTEGIRITSIFFQEFDGLSNPKPDHPVQHVYGKECLEENLGNCTFQISPGAFFQVNTEGAEVLYNIVLDRIREVTTDQEQTLLLDVCCGTGTIGLTCLKEGVVGKLVGVDIAAPAIADANINAKKNGFTDDATTRFIASAAEKVLPATMADLPKDAPIVAVVDPARDGLHGVVVRTLRANEKIQRLVYVSCNPIGTLARDAAMLCNPPTKKYPGRPFKITKSQPVDMFPLTKHCEMVMTFDRMSQEEYEKYHS